MKTTAILASAGLAAALGFTAAQADPSNLPGGTWVDPLGCEYNFFTSGTEGYLSEKRTPDGAMICTGGTPSSPEPRVWLDPDGCAHWFINSGTRGLMANVRFPDGQPSCGAPARALAQRFTAQTLLATVWRDPNGCFHWAADDGFEGFMSPRLQSDGRPVCEGNAAPVNLTLAADALFDVNSAKLKPAAVEKLTNFFELMQKTGKSKIAVTGHTDSDGSEAYNRDLSVRRAASVAKFGSNYGVNAVIDGKGESEPAASNATAAGKAQNRRVEIAILD
ncbi:MAG: OmpA family protein [Pseudomonadota bacterium]